MYKDRKHVPFTILIILTVSCILLFGCKSKSSVDYVNPFIGTADHGHTFPGASLPAGLVQLGPDTDIHGWDWCSGYNYSDNSIMGFSHLHRSGMGAGDWGDILIMPTDVYLKHKIIKLHGENLFFEWIKKQKPNKLTIIYTSNTREGNQYFQSKFYLLLFGRG